MNRKLPVGVMLLQAIFFYALIQINFEEPQLRPVPTANR